MRPICTYIKQCRKERGLSQEGLGELLGVSAGTVSRHERGESIPPLRHLIAYEVILGVPISLLYAELRYDVEQGLRARLPDSL